MAATRPVSPRAISWLKFVLFIVCLIPAAWIALHVTSAVNPVEYVTHQTGTWTLNFFADHLVRNTATHPYRPQ